MNKSMTTRTKTNNIFLIICSSKFFRNFMMGMKSVCSIVWKNLFSTPFTSKLVFHFEIIKFVKIKPSFCSLAFYRACFFRSIICIKNIPTYSTNFLHKIFVFSIIWVAKRTSNVFLVINNYICVTFSTNSISYHGFIIP